VDIKVSKTSNSQIKIEITVPKAQLLEYKKKAVSDLGKSVKVPGFRPGKAPQAMVEKEIKPNALSEKILQMAVGESYINTLAKEKINPISDPQINVKKFVPGEVLEFEAEVYVWPEVKLGDWKKIKIKKSETAEVGKEEVEQVLKNLQKQKAEIKPVTRTAKKKDKVEIDFSGKIEGKALPELESKNHPIVLGENLFIPGFEDNLLGLKKGDKKEFSVSFPKDYAHKQFAGKKADFTVEVKSVEEVKLSELNDAFAKLLGVESFKKLEEEIKKSLEQNKKKEALISQEREVLEKLRQESKVEPPKFLLDSNLEKRLTELEEKLSKIGLSMEQYCQNLKTTPDELKKNLKSEVENELANLFILLEISKNEGIKVTPEELGQYKKEDEGQANLEQNLLLKKTIDFVRDTVVN